jgi:glycosyltransferase involved in cell wall biosynthesis
VLLVIDWMGAGGMERQIVELLKGLRRDVAVEIALAVLDSGGAFEPQAAELADVILPVRRRSRLDLAAVVGLIHHARTARVELVHAFGWMSGLAGLVAARALHIPIINGSIRAALPVLGARDRISGICARAADVIVANSYAGLVSYSLEKHPRARVVHNGIDLSRFAHLDSKQASEPTLCMVANFREFKDHATALRALHIIRRAVPGTRLIFVGRDVGTLDSNRRLMHELGLQNAVEIYTGMTRPEPLISASHIGLLTSQGEGISNALLEYMALGKPVVATNHGGNIEVVRHGETGYLVRDGSAEEVAERVIALLCNPSHAHAMGAAGRKHVAEAFSLERMVAEYQALYNELLGTTHTNNTRWHV